MKKKSVLIIDADKSHSKQLADQLKSLPAFSVIGNCSDTEEAVRAIDTLEPNLILMDVDLPQRSGFQVLSACNHLPAVIFTTSNESHALKAFEHYAIDYLLKPFPRERLDAALDKFLNFDSAIGFKDSDQERIEGPNRILVENGRRHIGISLDDITHFKADKDYTRIYTLNNKFYLSSTGIGNIEHKLDPKVFIRVHRSYIINSSHILGSYREGSKLFILLPNDLEISVGRHYLSGIKKMIF